MSFNQWVASDFFRTPTLRYIDIGSNCGSDGSYFDWFLDKRSGIDYIGKYEYLQDDFNRICDIVGLPRAELPWLNSAQDFKCSFRDYYDDRSIDIVRKKYSREIALFGYEF